LNNKNITASDIFSDLQVDFAITESFKFNFGHIHSYIFGNKSPEFRNRAPCNDFEFGRFGFYEAIRHGGISNRNSPTIQAKLVKKLIL
jgi:hypothetical protein